MSKFSCSGCNYTSSVKKCVQRHIKKKNKCSDSLLQILEIPIEIKCKQCNKKFSTMETLSYHLNNNCKSNSNDEELIKQLEIKITELNKEIEILQTKLNEKQNPNYKSKLNSVLRYSVWNNIIGQKIGVHKCPCCNLNEISQQNFHCGHIVSKFNGGEDIIDNLIPICGSCNSSMGITNMDSFIQKLIFKN